jgi:multidrug efflux pump subunit AcrA (membrane-fusion protein)
LTEPVRGRGAPRIILHLRRMRLAYGLTAVAALAVAGAATAAGAGGGSSAAATTSRTVTVAQGVVQSTVSGSGNLEAVTQSDLSFDLAGEITRVYVKAGEKVTEGQALLRLQPTDTTEAITWIRAPYSGTIASVGVATGDIVGGTTASTTDATAAITLVQLKRYDLPVSLSESDIGKVKKGQMATVTVSSTGEKLAAKVIDVGVLSASSTTASTTGAASTSSSSASAVAYPVTLRLTQASSQIKPGMTASADIVTSQSTGLTIPTQALRGSTVTLVAGATQTPTRVQTGVAGDSMTEITSGLKAGDKVLVTSTSATAGASTSSTAATQRSGQNGLQGAGGFRGGGGATGGPPAGGPPGMGR